jgi:hypothetical protein
MECLKDAAYKWVWQTQVVHEALDRHGGPKLLMRYEDLRRDPHARFSELVAWLGTSADVDAIVERHAFERLPTRGAGEFNRSATPGGWRSNLSEAEQHTIEEIMAPTLSRFGYALEATARA